MYNIKGNNVEENKSHLYLFSWIKWKKEKKSSWKHTHFTQTHASHNYMCGDGGGVSLYAFSCRWHTKIPQLSLTLQFDKVPHLLGYFFYFQNVPFFSFPFFIILCYYKFLRNCFRELSCGEEELLIFFIFLKITIFLHFFLPSFIHSCGGKLLCMHAVMHAWFWKQKKKKKMRKCITLSEKIRML